MEGERLYMIVIKHGLDDIEKYVSKNFQIKELMCHCPICDISIVDEGALLRLQNARSHYGKPIILNCFFRCLYHNAKLPGARYSDHLCGRGADVRTTDKELIRILKKYFDFTIVHSTYVHCSYRP